MTASLARRNGAEDFPAAEIEQAQSSRLDDIKPSLSLKRALMEATRVDRERIVKAYDVNRPPNSKQAKWQLDEDFFDRLLKTFEAKGLLRQVPPPRRTDAAFTVKRAALETRYRTMHARTLQAVGVMRARALQEPEVRGSVDELSPRGDSFRAIEDEGEELLAVWTV